MEKVLAESRFRDALMLYKFLYAASPRLILILLFSALTWAVSSTARAELYINEMFFDPGGNGDDERDEYIELRGAPGMSLANHFLILVENEDNLSHTGGAGVVENIFTLGDDPNTATPETPYALGGNGFLLMRQKNSLYANISSAATDLVNTASGQGYGSDATSSIRHSGEGGKVKTENSGFTAMLIRNDGDPLLNQPFLGLDLDAGNDGLDPIGGDEFGWRSAWTIIDAIGVFSEAGEAGLGRLYAPINFGPELPGETIPVSQGGPTFTPRVEPGATYVGLNYEIEYLARWGNSTGQTASDWHTANLTDHPASGSTGVPSTVDGSPDYRQSGGFHDTQFADPPGPNQRVETNQGVPYETPLLTNLGSANLFYDDGDFDFDGDVDGADFLTWQRGFGKGDGVTVDALVTATRADGDTNGDWLVDGADLAEWKNHFTSAALPSSFLAVPEPSSGLLLIVALALPRRRQRRTS